MPRSSLAVATAAALLLGAAADHAAAASSVTLTASSPATIGAPLTLTVGGTTEAAARLVLTEAEAGAACPTVAQVDAGTKAALLDTPVAAGPLATSVTVVPGGYGLLKACASLRRPGMSTGLSKVVTVTVLAPTTSIGRFVPDGGPVARGASATGTLSGRVLTSGRPTAAVLTTWWTTVSCGSMAPADAPAQAVSGQFAVPLTSPPAEPRLRLCSRLTSPAGQRLGQVSSSTLVLRDPRTELRVTAARARVRSRAAVALTVSGSSEVATTLRVWRVGVHRSCAGTPADAQSFPVAAGPVAVTASVTAPRRHGRFSACARLEAADRPVSRKLTVVR